MASILDFMSQAQQPSYSGMDQQSLAPQAPSMIDPTTISRRIQEWLGAIQPDQGGTAQDILTSRLQPQNAMQVMYSDPTSEDVGNSAIASAQSGKYVPAQAYADNRMNAAMATLAKMKALRENAGGATGELVDRLMKSNPGMSFQDALYSVQTGMRQGLTRDAQGNVVPMAGVPEALGAISEAKQTGQNKSDLAYKPAIAGGEANARNQSETFYAGPKAIASKVGEATATAITALPQIEQNVDYSKNLLASLVNHPGLSTSVGAFSILPGIPGTNQMDFRRRLGQINSQAFLQAFAGLRGGGSISNAEGEAATQAITRLSAATSKDDFINAANELSQLLDAGLQRQKAEAAGNFTINNGVDQGIGRNNPGLNLSGANALPAAGENLNIDPSAALEELRRRGHKL